MALSCALEGLTETTTPKFSSKDTAARNDRLFNDFMRKWISDVLGPVPGVDVVAKRSQGWVKCEERLPYYRDSSCSLPLPRLHDPPPDREPQTAPKGISTGPVSS
jgi:hypothetical protein